MNVVKPSRIRQYWGKHRRAETSLKDWLAKARKAKWESFEDCRKTFKTADQVKVGSGKITTVFDIGGGNYRLITAIHYNRHKVFVLDFLTHADYDKNKWKAKL